MLTPRKIACEMAATMKEKKKKNKTIARDYLPLSLPLIIPPTSNWRRQ